MATSLGFSCSHVGYSASKKDPTKDLVVVKAYEHFDDGTKKPVLHIKENVQREFYITKPHFQTHREKKTYEDKRKLQKYTSNEAGMPGKIKKLLNINSPRANSLKDLASDPYKGQYIYGADTHVTTHVKQKYRDKWSDLFSELKLAVYDIETDVNFGEEWAIMAAGTCKENAVLTINRWWIEKVLEHRKDLKMTVDQFLDEVRRVCYEELSNADFGQGPIDIVKQRKLNIEILLAENAGETHAKTIQKFHEWKPDVVTVWNINFDLKKAIGTPEKKVNGHVIKAVNGDLQNFCIDPAVVFCDPNIPDEYKRFHYDEAPRKRVTAKGTTMSFDWYQQWHWVDAPASFVWMDQAAVWYDQRKHLGKEPMGLDRILKKYAGIGKLKTDDSGLEDLAWHEHMQLKEPFKYCAYCIFDCIGPEMLDEHPKVGDIRSRIGTQLKSSSFHDVQKLPKRVCDSFTFFLEKRNKVMGTASRNMITEFDEATFPPRGWITTLKPYLIRDNGVRALSDNPKVRTLIRRSVYDQ